VDVENREDIIPGIFFQIRKCCKWKSFRRSRFGRQSIGASRERAHFRSAISPPTASATAERWGTFSKLWNMLRQARAKIRDTRAFFVTNIFCPNIRNEQNPPRWIGLFKTTLEKIQEFGCSAISEREQNHDANEFGKWDFQPSNENTFKRVEIIKEK
jgi:hypothetical protein